MLRLLAKSLERTSKNATLTSNHINKFSKSELFSEKYIDRTSLLHKGMPYELVFLERTPIKKYHSHRRHTSDESNLIVNRQEYCIITVTISVRNHKMLTSGIESEQKFKQAR